MTFTLPFANGPTVKLTVNNDKFCVKNLIFLSTNSLIRGYYFSKLSILKINLSFIGIVWKENLLVKDKGFICY